ncbi:P-loop containing nucleoside triphosphate hydrolase protein [Piromyces finnis]|uniref:p-loop containing nucleoside triphosphate hydrolase protein n=1 Tax=Piromyces finnis TaxID=1754191 RepID=A0A1Y1VAE5_9FUNG|nr:P-loop containing nucleoside triphosphate hydrolase protein [Piromyces finnis]|eukprot:ORX51145.1 P-loop containing nucleoside triphosphate hydrolase protein [Piromyces finnis]
MEESNIQLTEEQELFIKEALLGKNILVDACIGSGKTTAIQNLCNKFDLGKKILYLTYNRLLKIDAKSKIKKRNVLVQNYHGFSYMTLKNIGIKSSQSLLIQKFLEVKPPISKYDVLILDEYQDIDEEISELLKYIKLYNSSIQIIAVGDMEQKIYDCTTLDVISFIKEFLDDYKKLEFTKCFRLSSDLANMLGRVWNKNIVGVNEDLSVEDMTLDDVVEFLSTQEPKDILCLGKSKGMRDNLLNSLEMNYPEKFNKNTVYAKISDNESIGLTKSNYNSAIFTTYDSSKGLEKSICVICDFNKYYWKKRIDIPNTRYEIIRNIFCVAASRGKKKIIFLNNGEDRLSETTLSINVNTSHNFRVFNISTMFDFKYKEDIRQCYKQLDIKKIEMEDTSEIRINNSDGLIDLSPCIGNYQEVVFFENYNINKTIELKLTEEEVQKLVKKIDGPIKEFKNLEKEVKHKVDERFINNVFLTSLDEKILYLAMLETRQRRYRYQVKVPFVSEKQKELIINRLKTIFQTNEEVQRKCMMEFNSQFQKIYILGCADVIKNDIVYELKFVSELSYEHFLQCACYMVALNLEKGILWNTKNNT